jgi:Domain of unknown function (DUF1772)
MTGYIFSFSFVGVPLIKLAPTPASQATLWAKAFQIGSTTAPFVAALSCLSFAYLTSNGSLHSSNPRLNQKHQSNKPFPVSKSSPPNYTTSSKRLYTAAAIIIPCIVPFTLLFMRPTNNAIHAKKAFYSSAVGAGIATDAELSRLIAKWTVLNYTRSLLPLLGTLLGAWAVVGRPEVAGLVVGGSGKA